MTKSFLFSVIFVLFLIGCGGNATTTSEDCDPPPPAPTGCAASPYDWKDEVLFICAGLLAFTELSGASFVQVADFQFVNYRGLWVNSITRVCVKNVGPTSLDTVSQINFATSLSSINDYGIRGPWPADGKVCVDIPITVGAESIEALGMYISSFPPVLPAGAQYQFEIEDPADVTFGENADAEPIVGDFPVKADMVTIVNN